MNSRGRPQSGGWHYARVGTIPNSGGFQRATGVCREFWEARGSSDLRCRFFPEGPGVRSGVL
eukprot:14884078-Alexandrium_andersonii.AAC.2